MADIAVPPAISSLPPLSDLQIIRSNSQQSQSLQKMIDASVMAMRELARRSIQECPSYRLLTLSLNTALPPSQLQAIDLKLVKTAIAEAATTTFPIDNSMLQGFISHADDGTDKIFENSGLDFKDFSERLKRQFIQFTAKIIKNIRNRLQNNEKTAGLNLSWKESSLDEIYQSHRDAILSCKTIRQVLGLINPSFLSQSREGSLFEQQIRGFKQLLSRLSGNIKVKMEIFQQFQKKAACLQKKEEQEERWNECCRNLQSTIRQQIQQIALQQQDNQQLEVIIAQLNQQLAENKRRVEAIEHQMVSLEQELKEEKQQQTQPQTDSYYINPLYDRAQLEEKLLTEMIQIESDLLEVKGQNQMLTDGIVEIIKLAQSTLQDFQISKYFISSFNRSVYRITSDIKSLENVDLQQLLNLREDTHSLYESELFVEETRRSHISSYSQSETELDQKLSRITEDDIPAFHSL